MEDVPTSALIVFTNPKVQLRVEGCSSTVTRLKELKDVLRRLAGKGQTWPSSRARPRSADAVRRPHAGREFLAMSATLSVKHVWRLADPACPRAVATARSPFRVHRASARTTLLVTLSPGAAPTRPGALELPVHASSSA